MAITFPAVPALHGADYSSSLNTLIGEHTTHDHKVILRLHELARVRIERCIDKNERKGYQKTERNGVHDNEEYQQRRDS